MLAQDAVQFIEDKLDREIEGSAEGETPARFFLENASQSASFVV